jgi:methionine-gamma-lyase
MISFEITGGEAEAFRFLNALKLFKIAVSLGGTESLAEHPRTMTHAGLQAEHLDTIGVSDNLIRLSIGVENVHDLLSDIENALEKVKDEQRVMMDFLDLADADFMQN